jgi:hypothetical protein
VFWATERSVRKVSLVAPICIGSHTDRCRLHALEHGADANQLGTEGNRALNVASLKGDAQDAESALRPLAVLKL